MIVHPFAPVYDECSEILLLGSFPSVKSRENGFYYGHPQNRFWKVLAKLYDTPTPDTVEEKIRLLLDHRLTLYDAASECEIRGSADSSIKQAVCAELGPIFASAPLRKVCCNGKLSGRLYALQAAQWDVPYEVLPSTSPANAAWSLERLTAAWRHALIKEDT